MNTGDFKRKLTAVFSADVAGYSRLMGEDEAATVKTLEAYKQVMFSLIKQHRGRVVDSPGDNLLAEFASVVDAVQCGVAIQKELQARNADLIENRRMEFRIGINLGDVIEEGERIYGDGVNIAARLESCADPGGICVSKTAFDHIETKLPLGYEYLGEKEVKNIAKPVGAYRVVMEPRVTVAGKEPTPVRWRKSVIFGTIAALVVIVGGVLWYTMRPKPPATEPASVEKMAFPLPDKPSIAVLPFDNLTGDVEQDYLADGMTENIISTLSKIPELFVIARNSSFTYKGKPVKVQRVAEELGVRHILEGSVQKSDNRVRVTAQLIDAVTGYHLWSEQFDRDLRDLFGLQDQITKEIVVALQVELTHGEQARIWHKTTDNIQAWGYCVKAVSLYEHFTKEDNVKARQLLERAVDLDPHYAYAWTLLAWTHFIDVRLGFGDTPSESLKKAVELAKKASGLDDTLPDIHALWNTIYLVRRQYDKAIAEGERSIALGPNNACAHALHAQTMIYTGRFEQAISLAEKSIRLSPHYPAWYLLFLGASYRWAGRCEEALVAYLKLLERSRQGEFNIMYAHMNMASTYADCGGEREANIHASEVLRINPNFFIGLVDETSFYQDPAYLMRFKDSLRKAGLPETPPLRLPDKPSIAVLPFVNMSGDPEQEYFSEGITEEIITALSKTPKMVVIARTSSFKYKGKGVDVRAVGRELGVHYVLKGSVRRSEDRLRVTAQLVEAKTGHHLWADRWDRELKDIFAVQDDITMKITTSLHVKLTEGEQARIWSQRAKSLDVFLKVLEARWFVAQGTAESHERLGQVAQEIIDMAPEIAVGYNWLAWYYWLRFSSQISPQESLTKAYQLARKALSMDEADAASYRLLGNVYLFMRQYDKAVAAGERSIALEPSSAASHGMLGITLSYAGDSDEAIMRLNQGIRLNPFPPYWYFVSLGRCYVRKGQYEKALGEYNKAQEVAPDNFMALGGKTVALSLLGREQEARAAARRFSEINPYFSVDMFASIVPYRVSVDIDKVTYAMRKAGLK